VLQCVLQCASVRVQWHWRSSYLDMHIYCVLQCVAVCCSVLQRVAVRVAGILALTTRGQVHMLCVAVCCNVLQSVAVCCSLSQSVAVCCSLLQCVLQRHRRSSHMYTYMCCVLQSVAVCCSLLQSAAVYYILAVSCGVSQCVAVHVQ